MERYTIKYMEQVKDIEFIIEILRDRKNKCTNYYSPLSIKLKEIISQLEEIYNLDIKDLIKK